MEIFGLNTVMLIATGVAILVILVLLCLIIIGRKNGLQVRELKRIDKHLVEAQNYCEQNGEKLQAELQEVKAKQDEERETFIDMTPTVKPATVESTGTGENLGRSGRVYTREELESQIRS